MVEQICFNNWFYLRDKYFLNMGKSQPLFVYFRPFRITNWKKHRWCAWDSNPGLQVGRGRQINWAMAASPRKTMFHPNKFEPSWTDDTKARHFMFDKTDNNSNNDNIVQSDSRRPINFKILSSRDGCVSLAVGRHVQWQTPEWQILFLSTMSQVMAFCAVWG